MDFGRIKRAIMALLDSEGVSKRELSGFFRVCSMTIGTLLTLLVFYTAFNGIFPNLIQNSIVLCGLLALTFMWYPACKFSPRNRPSVIDICLSALALLVMVWTVYSQPRFEMRIPLVSDILAFDKFAGVVLVCLSLEACRRTAGIIVTCIAGVAIWYSFAGRVFDSIFRHPGFDFDKFVDVLYLTTEGVFGSLVGMISTVLYAFISFGVLLQATGGDKYFMDIALSLAGKRPGGPAKVAVVGSCLMGMISGSSVANIVTTGSVTIPMMKNIGYKPEEAGAVEACASSGGQVMPPIMGAGAFLMADYLGVSFFTVASVSFAPALLFYLGLWFFNDKIARKRGLEGLAEVPSFWQSVKDSVHMWVPIGVLIAMCMMKFSPFYSAAMCTIFVLIAAMLKQRSTQLIRRVFAIMESCAISMTSIAGIIAAAAIIVAIISQTGLMIKSTSIILTLSGGSMVLTILILLAISYVMGMGLPVTSCYVILAALGVPALVKCGAPAIGAHLMLFWSSMVAGITPPVCVAAYVAANVAKADPMRTGFQSLKMGSLFYLVPITFLYSNILTGRPLEILAIFSVLALAVYFYVVAIEGFMLTKMNGFERLVALFIFLALFASIFNGIDIMHKAAMIGVSLVLTGFMFLKQRRFMQPGISKEA